MASSSENKCVAVDKATNVPCGRVADHSVPNPENHTVADPRVKPELCDNHRIRGFHIYTGNQPCVYPQCKEKAVWKHNVTNEFHFCSNHNLPGYVRGNNERRSSATPAVPIPTALVRRYGITPDPVSALPNDRPLKKRGLDRPKPARQKSDESYVFEEDPDRTDTDGEEEEKVSVSCLEDVRKEPMRYMRVCMEQKCTAKAMYSNAGRAPAMYCEAHYHKIIAGKVCFVGNLKCDTPACFEFPTHGFTHNKIRRHCRTHAKPGMVSFGDARACTSINCDNQFARYVIKDTNKLALCANCFKKSDNPGMYESIDK